MMRTWAVWAIVLLAVGCEREDESASDVPRDFEPATEAPPTGPAEAIEAIEQPGAEPTAVEVGDVKGEPEVKPAPEPGTEATLEAGTTPEPAPTRDLGAELKAAIGIPTDCVQDVVATSPATIRIAIRATVRPTGRIILPSVEGSGLSDDARRCVERKVSRVVLKPLDDSVSQTISTVVEVERQPSAIVGSETGAPDPQLKKVRQPLPPRPEAASSGRPPLPLRPEVEPSGRPIQEPDSRKVKGPKPRPIDGHEVDEQAKEWR